MNRYALTIVGVDEEAAAAESRLALRLQRPPFTKAGGVAVVRALRHGATGSRAATAAAVASSGRPRRLRVGLCCRSSRDRRRRLSTAIMIC